MSVTCGPPAPCNCTKDQTCVLVGRTATSCGSNVCQDTPGSFNKGGSNAGATAGQAIAGAAAGLLVAYAIYWFWSRKRRQTRANALAAIAEARPQSSNAATGKVRFGADAKAGSGPAPRRSRMMSRQMGAEEKGMLQQEIAQARADLSNSPEGHVSSEKDQNPFEDDTHRSVSDFSFRSSHSTIDIPIVYIPQHSGSMSVSEGMGQNRESIMSGSTADKRASDAKRLTGSNLLVGHPARPSRDPALNLKLPKMAAPTSAAGFGVSPLSSPGSGSGFGTVQAPHNSPVMSSQRLSAGSDGLSVPWGDSQRSSTTSTSHMSVISHMSYILDPPQIVTANSAGRVEVIGHAQARTVALPSPNNSHNAEVSSPTSATLEEIKTPQLSRNGSVRSAEDPFADQLSAAVGQFNHRPLSTPTFGPSSAGLGAGSQALARDSYASQPGDVTTEFDMRNNPFHSQDIRASMNSSDDMSIFTSSSRPNTMSRPYSTTSSAHDSLLDGMPFMSVPSVPHIGGASPNLGMPSSPLFPTPPGHSPNPQAVASLADNPFRHSADEGELSDAPTLGNDPARDSHVSRASTAGVSVRSGYGSVLEDIPFRLGFGNDRISMFSDGSTVDNRFSTAASDYTGRYSVDAPPVPALAAEHAAPRHQDVNLPEGQNLEVMLTPKMEDRASFGAFVPPADDKVATNDSRLSSQSFMADAMLAAQLSE